MIDILIAGDFCPYDRVANLIEEQNFYEIFGDVVDVIRNTDLSIVNLEAPVVETDLKPIIKSGPSLKTTNNAVKAIKYAGFDLATLANNHIFDYGAEGINQTLAACKKENLDIVGIGSNLENARKIYYKSVKGVCLAIINCCEHEFSIATDNTSGANPINPVSQYYSISEARLRADKVIVIVHGGHEYYQLPSPRMQQIYRFFIDIGADAVINHHQHCFSGYEIYNERPIIYGLGNLSFDDLKEKNKVWNEGYMVKLSMDDRQIIINTIPYIQGGNAPGVKLLKDRTLFDARIVKLNNIIKDSNILNREFEKWMSLQQANYINVFEPYFGRILSALKRRGLLPSFVKGRKVYKMLNTIQCESHLDCLKHSFIRRL